MSRGLAIRLVDKINYSFKFLIVRAKKKGFSIKIVKLGNGADQVLKFEAMEPLYSKGSRDRGISAIAP